MKRMTIILAAMIASVAWADTPTYTYTPTYFTPTHTHTYSLTHTRTYSFTKTFTKSFTPSKTRTRTPTKTFSKTPADTLTPTPTPTVCIRDVSKSGGTFSNLAGAVKICRRNDIIEIRDSEVYNEVFAPDQQITLRVQAGHGYHPTIGSSVPMGIGIDQNQIPLTDCVTIIGDGGLSILGYRNAVRATDACGSMKITQVGYVGNLESYQPVVLLAKTGDSTYPDVYSRCRFDAKNKDYSSVIQLIPRSAPVPQLQMFNCVAINAGKSADIVRIQGPVTVHVADFINCDFAGAKGSGIKSDSPVTVINSAFSGNGTNVNLAAPATAASSSYCAFVGTPPAGSGVSQISITAATEYVSAGSNFHLKAGAASRGKGLNVALTYAFSDDFDGIARTGTGWDIGAYQVTPTTTPTMTKTYTAIHTASATPTSTPTSSPTSTPTSTPSWTGTWSPTSTPSVTPTWTQTDTPVCSPTHTPTCVPGGYCAAPSMHCLSETSDSSDYLWEPAGGKKIMLKEIYMSAYIYTDTTLATVVSAGVTLASHNFTSTGAVTFLGPFPSLGVDDNLQCRGDGLDAFVDYCALGYEQ